MNLPISLTSRIPQLVLWVGVLVMLVAGSLLFTTFWGDSTIYLPYARNIAAGDFFSYNPGQFSSGSTSPLWAVLLSIPYLLGADVWGAKLLSLLASVAAFFVLMRLVWATAGGSAIAAIVALYAVEMLTFFGVMMYESGLIVLLISLSLLCSLRIAGALRSGGNPSIGLWLRLAAVWGAIPLTRPDATVLVVLQAGALWWFAGGRTRVVLVRLLSVGVIAAIPAACYFGYSYLTVGAFSVSSVCRAFALQESAQRIGAVAYSKPALEYLGGILYMILPAAVGFDLLRRQTERWLGWAAAAGVVGYSLLLVFLSPVTNDLSRYFLPIAPLLVVGAATAFGKWEQQARQEGGKGWGIALIAIGLIFLIKPIAGVIGQALEQRTRGYTFDEIVEKEAAQKINAVAPAGATVLAYEVQDRYYLRPDLQLLSLDGITDGKVAPYLASGDMVAFLKQYRPGYYLANDAVEYRPYLRKGLLFNLVAAFQADTTLRQFTSDGITFSLLERRARPMPKGFAGWRALFTIQYHN